MSKAIELDVIGDSSLFTPLGKGVAYVVRAGASEYMVDCGATPFHALGHDRIAALKGLLATHSHEDHRRWFTDLVLYMRYHPKLAKRLPLLTSEAIHEEFEKNSRGALERSLSADSRRVVDVPYSEFVERTTIGPRARYRIAGCFGEGGWRVTDAETGAVVPPSRAKVFVNPAANRPRMLFKDPDLGEWVEPESFYDFSSDVFYHRERNDHVDPETGLAFRAVKAAAWHGPPTIGILVTLGAEKLAFSSDTVYDPCLWKELAETRRPSNPAVGTPAFEEAFFVSADINDYIERTWSRARYEEAMRCFDGAVVIHDADFEQSVVHTPHSKFTGDGDWRRLMLTHTPDGFASAHPMTVTGRKYRLRDRDIFEVVDGADRALDADVYFKSALGEKWVGYSDEDGPAALWETSRGMLMTFDSSPPEPTSRPLGRYRPYMDIDGRYFAPPPAGSYYRTRKDGRVELMTEAKNGSTATIVQDLRTS